MSFLLSWKFKCIWALIFLSIMMGMIQHSLFIDTNNYRWHRNIDCKERCLKELQTCRGVLELWCKQTYMDVYVDDCLIKKGINMVDIVNDTPSPNHFQSKKLCRTEAIEIIQPKCWRERFKDYKTCQDLYRECKLLNNCL